MPCGCFPIAPASVRRFMLMCAFSRRVDETVSPGNLALFSSTICSADTRKRMAILPGVSFSFAMYHATFPSPAASSPFVPFSPAPSSSPLSAAPARAAIPAVRESASVRKSVSRPASCLASPSLASPTRPAGTSRARATCGSAASCASSDGRGEALPRGSGAAAATRSAVGISVSTCCLVAARRAWATTHRLQMALSQSGRRDKQQGA